MKALIGPTIGKRVRDRRFDLDWTQDELAVRTGIPQGSISRIENGWASDIQVATLLRLAQALHLEPADLLHGIVARQSRRSRIASPA